MFVKVVFVASDTDIAWAAGLFDGEGSTTVLKAKRARWAYVRMNVPQKDRRVLDKFQSIVGVGSVYKAKTRDIYSLDIYKEERVTHTLNMLWPYLSELKKEQALTAYKKVDDYRSM